MKNIAKILVITIFFFLIMLSYRLSHAQPNTMPDQAAGPWAANNNQAGPGNNNGNGNGGGNGNACNGPNPPKWCNQNNVPIEGPQMLILIAAGMGLGVMAIKKLKMANAAQ